MHLHSWHYLSLSLVAILLTGAGGPGFNGCASSGPSTPSGGTRLPTPDASLCTTAADCRGDDECISYNCVAGVCIETSEIIDDDGDGVAPLPCGQDCNDDNALVAPGIFELCDGLDNDCDSNIDENLSGWSQQTAVAPSVSASVGALGSDLALATAAPELVFIRRVQAGVPVGPNAEAMRLTAGTRFARTEVEAVGENAVAVFGLTDLGAALAVTVTSDAEGRLNAGERENLGRTASMSASDPSEMWTTSFGDGAALALRTSAEAVTVLPSLEGTSFAVEILETETLRGFATDGTHLVLLVDQDLRFYMPDGTQVGSGVPALSATDTLFSEAPLASGDGVVYLGSNRPDGTLSVTSVDSLLMLGSSPLEVPSPSGTGAMLYASDGEFWIATLDPTAGYSAGFATVSSTSLDAANLPQSVGSPDSNLRFGGPSRALGLLIHSEGTGTLRVLNFCGE